LAVDVSPGALAVAREHAAAHGLQDRVVLLEGDLLAPVAQELTQGAPAAGGRGVDAAARRLASVVRCPHHIVVRKWDQLPREVRESEPREALDARPDGLAFYRRLIPQAAALLKAGGLLAAEIGPDQAAPVRALLAAAGRWDGV